MVNETYKVGISLDIILFVSKLKTEVKLSKLPKKNSKEHPLMNLSKVRETPLNVKSAHIWQH